VLGALTIVIGAPSKSLLQMLLAIWTKYFRELLWTPIFLLVHPIISQNGKTALIGMLGYK